MWAQHYYERHVLRLRCRFAKVSVHRNTVEAYLELYQTSKMECFAVNYFCKTLHLRCFTEFWIRLCIETPPISCPCSHLFQCFPIFSGKYCKILESINPFLVNIPILHPLQTPENIWFLGVFRRYKMGALARNEWK